MIRVEGTYPELRHVEYDVLVEGICGIDEL